ncbi:MAG: InlB B-repeat-containing protein [Bacteroidales bacterium]|nr:InlB B-repeat-containing protein [Bacteroidales bacterium]
MKFNKLLTFFVALGLTATTAWATIIPTVSVTHEATTTNYETLTDALEAAQDDDVITLLSDVNLTDVLTVNKNITLDLAGYTIDRGLANSETAESNGNVININYDCTLTLDDSSADKTGTITGGYNNSYSGGVYVKGTFIMNAGTITGNQSSDRGGGVYVLGTFTMNDGAITRNQASNQGGGVYLQGTFTMNGGAITENRSNYSGGWWGASADENVGGGVFVGYGNHFYVSGAPKITGNVFSLSGTGEPSAADLCFSRLDEDFIGLTGALTEGASIGIRSKSAYTLTSEWSTYMGTNKPSDYLFSNNGYRIGVSNEGEATLTSDILDLQAEIDAAEDGSTITLQKDYVSLSGDNQLLLRGRALTLDLNGHTIDYSANNISSCIIRCEEGTTLTLKDSGGEGKLIGNPDKSYFYGISYGNAAADGTLNSFTMEGGTISGCSSAGVYVYSCVFTMKGGTISGNVGYGVNVDSNSDMILSDGEISNNGKSGVYFSSYNQTFTMTGGKITNNYGSCGAGVYIGGGTFYMEGGEISGNISNYYGGGLYCSSNVIMSGGKITDNHCASSSIYNSGGVYASNGITISGNVTITGNTQGDSDTENNMYLAPSQMITIDAPLDTASRIGVLYSSSDEYLPTANLTSGFAEYAHWENFVVDEGSNCRLATDGEELVWTSMTNEDMSHAVTFMDGETTLLTEYVKVAENAHAVEPIVPTKDGLSFVGWMLNDEVYDFSTAVTGDITLTAVWAKNLTADNIADIDAQTYTGSAIEPEVVVTDGETTLALGTDYTVVYSDNINAGTATVTITGIGNYSGTVEKTFTINRAEPTYTAPTAQTIACNQTLADIELPEGFEFENVETEIAVGSTKIVTLKYTPSDVDNYEVVTGIELSVTKTDHSFTNYVYNNDATELADGTETAVCDHGCGATDTRTAEGTKLPGSVTAVNNVEAEKQHAKKYLENGILIIEVNGVKYDVTGRVVK